MDLCTDIAGLRAALAKARLARPAVEIALVPTMGALHEGHLKLVDAVAGPSRFVVTSIFVNPTQFGPQEDFSRYPRTLEADLAQLKARGVHLVFAPGPEQMYPAGDKTRVRVHDLTDVLCGPFRPGHFEGVATVVSKFFAVVQPDVAIFGRKDYQQLAVIRRMAKDLLFPVEIQALATVREPDGLAKSSRNMYLAPDERARAAAIPAALAELDALIEQGRGRLRAAEARARFRASLSRVADSIDYAEVADPEDLRPLADDALVPPRVLLALACRIGKTRLIDNMVTSEDVRP
jgi:pantoate--beta-alanine ligase